MHPTFKPSCQTGTARRPRAYAADDGPLTGGPANRSDRGKQSEHECADGVEKLTPREKEVSFWIAAGKRDSEIGIILGISVLTVHKHAQHIYRKLGVTGRCGVVRLVLDADLGFGSYAGLGVLPKTRPSSRASLRSSRGITNATAERNARRISNARCDVFKEAIKKR